MNVETKVEQRRRYYVENRDRIREQQHQYRETHKEETKERNRRYCAEHCEENRARSLAWQRENRERYRERQNRWRKEHPEKTKEYGRRWREKDPLAYKRTMWKAGLKHRYGMSDETYRMMYASQSGKCLICGQSEKILCVDHNHVTGVIRGLLCHVCNSGIGRFQDDPGLCEKAAQYLRNSMIPGVTRCGRSLHPARPHTRSKP